MSERICSRAGCRDEAVWQVVWRNPRIHAADRRKVWAACGEHVAFLRDYLATRGFPVQVVPFETDAISAGAGRPAPSGVDLGADRGRDS